MKQWLGSKELLKLNQVLGHMPCGILDVSPTLNRLLDLYYKLLWKVQCKKWFVFEMIIIKFVWGCLVCYAVLESWLVARVRF